jgi:hypothetical protein
VDEYKRIPSYVDLGEGRTIDENRWPLLLSAVVQGWREANPDAPELRPGHLETKPQGEHRILVVGIDVTGVVHELGWFDPRWLDASVPMPGGRGELENRQE